jgi:hypothetical protein
MERLSVRTEEVPGASEGASLELSVDEGSAELALPVGAAAEVDRADKVVHVRSLPRPVQLTFGFFGVHTEALAVEVVLEEAEAGSAAG